MNLSGRGRHGRPGIVVISLRRNLALGFHFGKVRNAQNARELHHTYLRFGHDGREVFVEKMSYDARLAEIGADRIEERQHRLPANQGCLRSTGVPGGPGRRQP